VSLKKRPFTVYFQDARGRVWVETVKATNRTEANKSVTNAVYVYGATLPKYMPRVCFVDLTNGQPTPKATANIAYVAATRKN
jgi:hypothetical protein